MSTTRSPDENVPTIVRAGRIVMRQQLAAAQAEIARLTDERDRALAAYDGLVMRALAFAGVLDQWGYADIAQNILQEILVGPVTVDGRPLVAQTDESQPPESVL